VVNDVKSNGEMVTSEREGLEACAARLLFTVSPKRGCEERVGGVEGLVSEAELVSSILLEGEIEEGEREES
jgi:hypothetical protein